MKERREDRLCAQKNSRLVGPHRSLSLPSVCQSREKPGGGNDR